MFISLGFVLCFVANVVADVSDSSALLQGGKLQKTRKGLSFSDGKDGTCSDPNAEWTECGVADHARPVCGAPNKIADRACHQNCQCKKGYILNKRRSKCITLNQCENRCRQKKWPLTQDNNCIFPTKPLDKMLPTTGVTTECEPGSEDKSDVCQPKICTSGGSWVSRIIDCPQAMGVRCDGNWVDVPGQCCQKCEATTTTECSPGSEDKTNLCQPKTCTSSGTWVSKIIDCPQAMGVRCDGNWVDVPGQCCQECEATTPTECSPGSEDKTNLCQPKTCTSSGTWVSKIIDCPQAMGVGCDGIWVDVPGQCCRECFRED